MKRVCAWCGQDLNPAESAEDMGVTHGLCLACRSRFFPSAKAKEADSPSIPKEKEGELASTANQAPQD